MTRTTAPFGRRAAMVTARKQQGAYVVIRCEDARGPHPRAGQFYMLASAERWGGGAGERPFLPRAFSVLRARTHELHFLIEDVGPGTKRLCELRPGEELLLTGPLGNGFSAPREQREPLLVGGGVGIAPLAIWQDELGPGIETLVGFRDRAHAAGAALLGAPTVATDDGSVGHHGLVTDLLEDELAARGERREVYACGPPPMLEAVRVACAERGVPAQLALEAGMACGFGACFGCVVPTRNGYVRLCVDGPVLDAAELAGASSVGSSAGAELQAKLGDAAKLAGASSVGSSAGAELQAKLGDASSSAASSSSIR
jgi:dihydroorotate dehydrogenase electron transfer subunit